MPSYGCGHGHASALAVRLGAPADVILALRPGRRAKESKEIEATYDYVDESGSFLSPSGPPPA